MEKVVGPLLAPMIGFTLCHLILMVREGQVHATGVDVQLTPKDGAEPTAEV